MRKTMIELWRTEAALMKAEVDDTRLRSKHTARSIVQAARCTQTLEGKEQTCRRGRSAGFLQVQSASANHATLSGLKSIET